MVFDLEWLYDIYVLEIWHVFSIIFSIVFLCYIILNARKNALFYHYLALQVILLNWLISKVFKTIAPTAEIKWVFIVAQYSTVCFLGSALLMFGYLYSKGKPLPLRISLPLNIPPLFFFFVIATNEQHHLFYTTYDFLGDTFGPLFYSYSAMTYLYIAIGIYYCAARFKKSLGPLNIQTRLLILGIVIPLIVNALYIGGISKFRFDITPVSCNISLLLFAYAIYKYRFLDVVPSGISLAFNNLQVGVLVFDAGGRILDKNTCLSSVINLHKEAPYEMIGDIDEKLEQQLGIKGIVSDMVAAFIKTEQKNVIREVVLPGEKEKYLSITVQRLNPQYKKLGEYMCVFYDNTYYMKLIRELEDKNLELEQTNTRLQEYSEELKRLAVMEERNRMAKEIHDILGHSLVLVVTILEGSYAMMDIDRDAARLKISQALSSARQGVAELQDAFRQIDNQRVKSIESLKNDLTALVEKYRQAGIKVHLYIKEQRKAIPMDHYHTVFRICQEALTNSLKHGAADEINIFVRINPEDIDVFVLDNGRGSAIFKKGHGVAGMEQRVKKLKGKFFCGSSEEKGFTVHAWLPC